MIRVLHLIDGSCTETAFQILALLIRSLSTEAYDHIIASTDGTILRRAEPFLPTRPIRAESRGLAGLIVSPRLMKMEEWAGPQIIHAWGLDAARSAGGRLRERPLLLTCLSPGRARDGAAVLRALPDQVAVAAGSQVIRSRLATAGVDPGRIVVIRGPADLAAINAARSAGLRRRIVGTAGPVILLDGPASREGGQYYGLWAAAIVAQVHKGLRVLLPYESSETERLQRFLRQIRLPELLVRPDRSLTWSQLAACADVFLCPATEEVCTDPLAAAMGGGLAVVGSAVRSVAEIIADRHNGLLAKPADPRALAGKLLTAIEDVELCRRLSEVARGQAYEVFGVRAFADNYARLYANMIDGRECGLGVVDTAMLPA